MGSLGAGELVVIAIAALVVFGPNRLPEVARRASQLLGHARTATQKVTDALDTEYGEVTAPLKDLKADLDTTRQNIKRMVPATPTLSFKLPDVSPRTSDTEPSTSGAQPGNDVDGRRLHPGESDGQPGALDESPSTSEEAP
jgi:sec-independent protein translocase protein TatB